MICGNYLFAMEDLSYTFVNDPVNYALTAVFVFCAMILSHLMTMRALKNWDIVEVVKEKE